MATNLVPHNVGEVCDALLAMLDKPEISVAELMQALPGPDFPTGGQGCGRQGIVDAYTTGRGTITVRGKLHVEEKRGGRKVIVITEIPYQVLRSTIIERIAAAVKDRTIKDVSAVNDASDRKHPVRIEGKGSPGRKSPISTRRRSSRRIWREPRPRPFRSFSLFISFRCSRTAAHERTRRPGRPRASAQHRSAARRCSESETTRFLCRAASIMRTS